MQTDDNTLELVFYTSEGRRMFVIFDQNGNVVRRINYDSERSLRLIRLYHCGYNNHIVFGCNDDVFNRLSVINTYNDCIKYILTTIKINCTNESKITDYIHRDTIKLMVDDDHLGSDVKLIINNLVKKMPPYDGTPEYKICKFGGFPRLNLRHDLNLSDCYSGPKVLPYYKNESFKSKLQMGDLPILLPPLATRTYVRIDLCNLISGLTLNLILHQFVKPYSGPNKPKRPKADPKCGKRKNRP